MGKVLRALELGCGNVGTPRGSRDSECVKPSLMGLDQKGPGPRTWMQTSAALTCSVMSGLTSCF